LQAIAAGLEAARAVAGRLVTHRLTNGATLIDDSYNANPGSLHAAIDTLAGLSGDSWLVLGDMRELGVDAEALHAEAGRRAKAAGIARLYTLGPLSAAAAKAFGDGAQHFEAVEPLIAAVAHEAQAGTTMLVKGSRFMRMERVVTAIVGSGGEGASH
jgi:UDP-N-acetylmuramoyl-tripeptide--D-alanyl-D-alanine ligase